MLDVLLFMISVAVQGQGDTPAGQPVAAAAGPGLTAQAQVPTGQFTTAVEVKPILNMTQANWVAVRDYNGQDLLYVSHLMAWRCGLLQMRWSVNDGALQTWPLPACYEGTAAPNAIKPEDGLPYVAYPPGSINRVTIEITYDDLEVQTASFERAQVLMP